MTGKAILLLMLVQLIPYLIATLIVAGAAWLIWKLIARRRGWS